MEEHHVDHPTLKSIQQIQIEKWIETVLKSKGLKSFKSINEVHHEFDRIIIKTNEVTFTLITLTEPPLGKS